MAKLTPRQAAFCRHLITGMSATEAARKAGYSDTYANREAAKLVVKPQVAAELERLRSKFDNSAIMSAQEVLAELTKLARANLLDYFRLTGDGDPVIDLSTVTPAQAAALAEIQVEDFLDGRGEDAREVRRVRIKMADKKAALELLGKHHQLFTDRVDLTSGGQPLKAYVGFNPEDV